MAAMSCTREHDAKAVSDVKAVADPNHEAFFITLSSYCGRTFEGASTFPADADDPMYGQKLTITFRDCDEDEIRVPFLVGENASRTWAFTRMPDGLLLKHDHRDENGQPDPPTQYGGFADGSGTSHRQSFPADQETIVMIPDAATNVWTLEVDSVRKVLIYDLQRHSKPRFRAEFHLR
jgi:hypothetical protein